MKTFSLVIFLFLILPGLASSQSFVSGNQSGTWSSNNSPFLVIGDVTVPTGQVLNIEPGVEVNFQGHHKLTVNGDLQAIGALNDTIFFTTDNPETGWGGIRFSSSDLSQLAFCRIEYGKSSPGYPNNHGGAVALFGSDAVFSNCVFADNDATANDTGMGGAVYASGTGSSSGPLTRFIDCRFIRNHCYGEGGAIKFTGDMNTEILGCEFFENTCNYGGGAISCYGVEGTTMKNCVFADNYTMYGAGGVLNTLGNWNTLFFINCTLTGNTAVTGDGGAINIAYGQAYFANTIIYNNNGMYSDDLHLDMLGFAAVYNSNLEMPLDAEGSGNINQIPGFVDAANRDFTLHENSPCIDSGIAYASHGGVVIVDLNPFDYSGPAPDMGAYEFSSLSPVSEGSTTICQLYQNHPNPFRSRTVINYKLAVERHVSVRIFNVRGQEIQTLIDGGQAPGDYSLSWNGRDNSGRKVSSGTYFLRLKTGNEIQNMRMVLTH